MPDRRDTATVRLGNLEFDHVVYDSDADVLYPSVGEPREPARQESSPDGHLVRYDAEDRVIGITLVNAKWLSEQDGEITVSIRVGAGDLGLGSLRGATRLRHRARLQRDALGVLMHRLRGRLIAEATPAASGT